MYRTTVARAVHGWDEQLHVNEDVDFDHRVRALGHRLAYHPDMEIYWHVREDLFALGHQYRRYGRGKGAMILKNGPRALAARHLAPPGHRRLHPGRARSGTRQAPPRRRHGRPVRARRGHRGGGGLGGSPAWGTGLAAGPCPLPWWRCTSPGVSGSSRACLPADARPRAAWCTRSSRLRRRRQPTTGRMDEEGPGQRQSTRRPRRSRLRRHGGRRARPRRPPATATGPR